MSNESPYSDAELRRIDTQNRKSKRYKRFEPKQPDDTIRCLNELNDTLGQILVEFRRLNDTLEYQEQKKK